MIKYFTNGIIYTGNSFLDNHAVAVENGIVKELLSTDELPENVEKVDLNGSYLIPGLIDLQVNGGGGGFFTKDPTEETLKQMYEAHVEFGTTSYLPTVISTSLENILTCIDATKKCMLQRKYGVIGMHLEGPFFNPLKKGAHFEKFLRVPTDELLRTIINHGEGVIKLITLAPELFNSKQLSMLLEAGIKISAGHSNAHFNEAMFGFHHGISMVTHLYNAMSQFTGRDPGLVGAFFNYQDAWGSIIVDGFHSNYASVKIAHNLKKGKLFLVSDASFIKHPVDRFEFDGFKIHFKDGMYLTESGNLAGSSISQLEGLQNCVRHAGISLEDTLKMAAVYPAEYLGVDSFIGKIRKGAQADFIVLNKNLDLETVYVQGVATQAIYN